VFLILELRRIPFLEKHEYTFDYVVYTDLHCSNCQMELFF